MFDRVEAAGAEDLKAAFIGRADANVLDGFIWPAVLDDKVGAAIDGERHELTDVESVFNAARLAGKIKFEGLPFQIYNCDQHGSVPRGGSMELDYHLD